MLIQALLPDIHRRRTGGNLFNRRILDFLDGVAEVERRVVGDGAPPTAGPAAVTLVDSLLLARAAGLLQAAGPIVLVAHYLHLFEPGRRDSAEAEREWRRLACVDGVVVPSEYCRAAFESEGFPPERLAVVTPGLAPAYAAEVGPRPPAPPRLLTVATLLEGKGLRQLLSLLEGLIEVDWRWEIAGDPDLDEAFADAFRERLRRSPVAGRVHLHGAVEPGRMVELYDRCHLFVLPSRFESCSMATMEAMARGLPVVAYRVGGLPERLPAANAELLAPPGEPGELAERLRRLLVDPARAAALGRANRRAGHAFPSWEASGERLWRFVRRIAGMPRRRRS